MRWIDPRRGRVRVALVDDGAVVAALFAAPEPVDVARAHVASAFGAADAATLLAGRPGDAPDHGRIVCACRNVGLNTIAEAVAAGRVASVAEIGALLGAGTTCGSCRPELAELLAAGLASGPPAQPRRDGLPGLWRGSAVVAHAAYYSFTAPVIDET